MLGEIRVEQIMLNNRPNVVCQLVPSWIIAFDRNLFANTKNKKIGSGPSLCDEKTKDLPFTLSLRAEAKCSLKKSRMLIIVFLSG